MPSKYLASAGSPAQNIAIIIPLTQVSVCLQLIGKQNYSHNNATLLGVVLNKVNPKEHSIISQQVKSKVHTPDFAFAGALPYNPLLTTVR